MKRYEMRLR